MSTVNKELKSKSDLGIIRLTAFAIGTTLASGVFSISGDMAANGANTAAVLTGWAISGIGMIALMMCFYGLNLYRPDLKSGVYSYAKEGFGDYVGFNSAFGYWISAIFANISFATLLFAALGRFFPIFGDGNNMVSMIVASLFIWFTVYLVLRGVSQAATINLIVVIAKILPILVLILSIVFVRAFKPDIFMQNFWGEPGGPSFFDQVKATTITTVWTFVGIEGAVVISGRAKRTKDAGTAGVIAFLTLLVIYVLISVLSMGVMSRAELAALGNPPMAGVLEHVLGPWGAALVNFAVILSLTGATFTYTMLAAESAYEPAAQGAFPKALAGENKKNAPNVALIVTNIIIQIFLIIVLFNNSTYQIFYSLSANMIMLPYFLSAMYYLKIILKKEGEIGGFSSSKYFLQLIIAIGGTIYGVWMLYASGLSNLLITTILYCPGTLLYIWRNKEKGAKSFENKVDLVIFLGILALFIISIVLIANGTIKPF